MIQMSDRCPLHEAVTLSRSERRCSRRLLRDALGRTRPRWLTSVLAGMVLSQAVPGGSCAAGLLLAEHQPHR